MSLMNSTENNSHVERVKIITIELTALQLYVDDHYYKVVKRNRKHLRTRKWIFNSFLKLKTKHIQEKKLIKTHAF